MSASLLHELILPLKHPGSLKPDVKYTVLFFFSLFQGVVNKFLQWESLRFSLRSSCNRGRPALP